jgi:hypothetical protein
VIVRSLIVALLLLAGGAHAGTRCRDVVPTPATVAAAADTALRVAAALDERDAPVALVARAGTDLSRQGLHYSHAAFALRDHRDGRWTLVHLLNLCGTARSSIHAQGLVNFFADDLVNQDVRITWLRDDVARELAWRLLDDRRAKAMHDPHYNLIARPDSHRWQNSTSWVLDMLGAAHGAGTRGEAQRLVRRQGFVPDRLHIPYTQRIAGGLFGSNVDFTDHPIATRLSGEYPVVTVRSILRWLEHTGAVAASREWRGGREVVLSPE